MLSRPSDSRGAWSLTDVLMPLSDFRECEACYACCAVAQSARALRSARSLTTGPDVNTAVCALAQAAGAVAVDCVGLM